MKLSSYAVLSLAFLAACDQLPGMKQESIDAAQSSASVQTQIDQAAASRKNGHAEEAVALMREAQTRQPDNVQVLMQLGYALIDAGHPEEAIDAFDRVILLNPANGAAYNAKGVAFDTAGNHLAAQELYQHALALSPGAPGIKNNLAMSLILNDQIDQAIALLEGLNNQPGANKTMRQNLALAYGLKGDKDKAMALNLQDLSPKEARDNMRFYEQYARKRSARKPQDAPASMQIGFVETPVEMKLKDAPTPLAASIKPAAAPAQESREVIAAPSPPANSGTVLPTSAEEGTAFPSQHKR